MIRHANSSGRHSWRLGGRFSTHRCTTVQSGCSFVYTRERPHNVGLPTTANLTKKMSSPDSTSGVYRGTSPAWSRAQVTSGLANPRGCAASEGIASAVPTLSAASLRVVVSCPTATAARGEPTTCNPLYIVPSASSRASVLAFRSSAPVASLGEAGAGPSLRPLPVEEGVRAGSVRKGSTRQKTSAIDTPSVSAAAAAAAAAVSAVDVPAGSSEGGSPLALLVQQLLLGCTGGWRTRHLAEE